MPNLEDTANKENLKKLNNVDILRLYQFDFFKSAIEAFIWQLTVRFRKYNPTFPVYLFNSGDELYILNEQKTIGQGSVFKKSDLYQTKPRVELTIDNISILTEQCTSPTQEGLFTIPVEKRDVTFHGPVDRVPVNFEIKGILVCDSLLHAFTYLELVLTMLKNNSISFEFWNAKRRHNGLFTIQTQPSLNKNLELSYNADSRDYVIDLPIILQLQFPAFDFFNPLENTIKASTVGVIENIDFNIYPEGGAGDQDGDQIDNAPIKETIDGSDEDNSGDELVGNVHNLQPIPGITNPDGSVINPNVGAFGQSDSNTGWKNTANTNELSSSVLDTAEEQQIGKKTHYPM